MPSGHAWSAEGSWLARGPRRPCRPGGRARWRLRGRPRAARPDANPPPTWPLALRPPAREPPPTPVCRRPGLLAPAPPLGEAWRPPMWAQGQELGVGVALGFLGVTQDLAPDGALPRQRSPAPRADWTRDLLSSQEPSSLLSPPSAKEERLGHPGGGCEHNEKGVLGQASMRLGGRHGIWGRLLLPAVGTWGVQLIALALPRGRALPHV